MVSYLPGPTKLDVSQLRGSNRSYDKVNLGKVFEQKIRPAIDHMMQVGLIETSESFGFVMAIPGVKAGYNQRHLWNDPYRLAWMSAGWGPNMDQCVANALRKLRPAVREGANTSQMHSKIEIQDKVKKIESDGTFNWGDIPGSGGVWAYRINRGGVNLVGAVDGLAQDENHVIAHMILGIFQIEIAKSPVALAEMSA